MGPGTAWWEKKIQGPLDLASIPGVANLSASPFVLADLLPWAVLTLAKAGIESAGFEMQLLLAQALGVSRVSVITGSYPTPDETRILDFIRLVWARSHRVPLAYLRGDQEFYGLPFQVTPDVLIPRPETEMLVDVAIRDYKAWEEKHLSLSSSEAREAQCEVFMVADVGAGSGCISIAILAHCATARAVGFDCSRPALSCAWQNARLNNVTERFRLVQGNLFTAAEHGSYDVIVSNPPYIPTDEIATLQPEVRDYEPPLALDGGLDGLECYPPLASDACRSLKPGGHLYVEVGQGQAQSVAAIFRAAGLEDVRIWPDLAGIERVVGGMKG